MKKILLLKVQQHSHDCYIGVLDPRELVKTATQVEMSATQEAQRPLSEKRIKAIASYVKEQDGGILPSTLTIATTNSQLEVKEYPDIDGLYYMDFPETNAEFEKYKDSATVMDGQHRLYSFLPNIRELSDNDTYQIGFTIYIQPSLRLRRQIFVTCNEKQEKVNNNLLMWFKEQLQMLSATEKTYHSLISNLNTIYPLKNRIIMSAEKITGGYKAVQVANMLKNAQILDFRLNGKELTEEQQVSLISIYLTAWEKVCGFQFATSKYKEAGAAIKSAGLRYMLLLLKPTWERSLAIKEKFTVAFVKDTMEKMIATYGVEREAFFTTEAHKLWFSDRTAIAYHAKEAALIIDSLNTSDFNPF